MLRWTKSICDYWNENIDLLIHGKILIYKVKTELLKNMHTEKTPAHTQFVDINITKTYTAAIQNTEIPVFNELDTFNPHNRQEFFLTNNL